MNAYYNRYDDILVNGKQLVVPFIELTSKNTDKEYIFRNGISRLDKISFEYYGSPLFGWLILQGNPEFGGLEANIPDNSKITIPFPLISSIQDYSNKLNEYFFHYGR